MILSCKDIHASYGQSQILFGVDLDVSQGELIALLGVNGAGKSTLLRTICGLMRPSQGQIHYLGSPIHGNQPESIAKLGISMVPGGQGVFPTLSVEDNLRIAQWQIRKSLTDKKARLDYALTVFPALSNRYKQLAGNLSGGEQQMLALAQSLITAPKLLLIDELSLGLAPIVVGSLIQVVRSVNEYGTTVILVEQSLNLALELCNRAIFMEKGTVRFDGPSFELKHRPDLLRSVFLDSKPSSTKDLSYSSEPYRVAPLPGEPYRVAPLPGEPYGVAPLPGEPYGVAPLANNTSGGSNAKVANIVLETRNISIRFGAILALQDINFILHDGEIMSIIGANGAGKTTLFDIISGFLKPDSGRVILNSKNVTRWSPARRALFGLGRSFQDALLFSSLTVEETIKIALDRHLLSKDPISLSFGFPQARFSERESTEKCSWLMSITGLENFGNKFLSELSTGTRRMVDLACSLAHDPNVLLLDEPAAGIAQKETEALGPLIRRIRDEVGTSILIIEHDIPLIRAISDRVMALELGQVLTTGTTDEVTSDPRVVASYLGAELSAINRSGEVSL